MDWVTLILGILAPLLAGVSIFQFIFIKQTKRKYKAEADKANAAAKSDEIENMKKAMESVYQPLIADQNKLIAEQSDKINELKREIETLRDEKQKQAEAYREEIAKLRDEIADVRRELANKADAQLRMPNGQFGPKKQ